MSLAAHAAAVRGDDFQHALGWLRACELLLDPYAVSVSIEDVGGGQFDDVVTRREGGRPHLYEQAKSSVHGDVVVSTLWLTTAKSKKGQSPLQHYFGTWQMLQAAGRPFDLAFVTNRSFDPKDPLLGSLRDLKSEKIDAAKVVAATGRTDIGKTRKLWLDHLGCDAPTLQQFLNVVRWQVVGSERQIDSAAKSAMRQAGLRFDDAAVVAGRALVRLWVTDARGPQTADDVRRQVAELDLLARSGTLLLKVDAIDRPPSPVVPTVHLDFMDLYDGDDPFNRRQLRDEQDWQRVVQPALQTAARTLQIFATRRCHVDGAMRLPLWFAVGRALPDVGKWVLSADQRGEEWSTAAQGDPGDTGVSVLADVDVGLGSGLALALAVAQDPTGQVEHFVRTEPLGVRRLLVLGPAGGVSQDAAAGPAWSSSWSRAVRAHALETVQEVRAEAVHLFLAVPAAVAMMIGHQWNLMPPTTVYEHLNPGYNRNLSVK